MHWHPTEISCLWVSILKSGNVPCAAPTSGESRENVSVGTTLLSLKLQRSHLSSVLRNYYYY